MGISIRAAVSLFMDPQFQYVRPGIVAHAVKLHTAGNGLLHIQIGVDDVLLVPHRLRYIVAVGQRSRTNVVKKQ